MSSRVDLHSFEPGILFDKQGPFTAEIIETDKSDLAALAFIEPPILVPNGELKGKLIRSFIFTPRHVGGSISRAYSGFSVVYLHPYEELQKIPVDAVNLQIPSEGFAGAIGYCIIQSSEANNMYSKFK